MEAASLVFSVAQTLFAALQSKELKEICSWWGCESELKRLQHTVNTIKSVLLDAESKQVLNCQQLNYVENLKAAVYDADDLLDEFTALAEQQQHLLDGSKVLSNVRLLFSRFGKLNVFRKMSKNVKKIRKVLDGVANDACQFSFKIDYEPIRRRREETCSYVHEKHVIGREKETKEIINMLLAPDSDNDVVQANLSVLAIVGMGGLGKTTLAQHIYEHHKIKSEFQLRVWVCVSDQDQDQLLLQPILTKVLESATGNKQYGLGIELMQRKLRELLQGKKYLLVLDDVWTENHNEWLMLENFFLEGGRGSRIMVTTRSEKTAQAVGSFNPYKLKGLSDENSWRLFERVAFGGREGQRDLHQIEMIGKEIVKKCSNVPLSIRVVGSLLYGQEKKNWVELQRLGLAEIIQRDNTLMPILKLSYHHLHPAMKSCFSYCALFPKDSVIGKGTLISLWMAQGYIEALHEGQSIEDAGEDYFLILLRRCFFQDVEKDEFGEIVSCKMHDLMHDMAHHVAGKEICVMDSAISSLDEKIRHVFDASYTNKDTCFIRETKIRTFIEGMYLTFLVIKAISEKWTCLRVLDLRHLEHDIRSLPDSFDNLLHLRYIDLSQNWNLEKLPESITQLHYLQTLILKGCMGLKELPNGLSKLRKLRFLDISGCWLISCMPSGMDKLTSLCRLSTFVVDEINLDSEQLVGGLDDLRALKDLRSDLTIIFGMNFRYGSEESRKVEYLSNKERLNTIKIWLHKDRGSDGMSDKALLEDLRPHENLKELELIGYGYVRLPGWVRADKLVTSLPNLVNIYLHGCCTLLELPSFSKLQHLKLLHLSELSSLEYMEDTTWSSEAPFFPCLEKLELYGLHELKGWWRGSVSGVVDTIARIGERASFPRLLELRIVDCSNLKSIALCPAVETLTLCQFNERLVIMIAEEEEEETGCYSGDPRHSSSLRSLKISNVKCMKSLLPVRAFHVLKELKIENDMQMESLSQVGEEVLSSCSSSLRSLRLWRLFNLKSLSGGRGGLEHLAALESLSLDFLIDLSFDEEGEDDTGMPWICLHRSLHSLELWYLPQMMNLPKGMRHLTSLQSLDIRFSSLKALPEWISCLSSLQSLRIYDYRKTIESLPTSMQQLTSLTRLEIHYCSERLHQRCQSPNGQYWPYIQHIPYIEIRKD